MESHSQVLEANVEDLTYLLSNLTGLKSISLKFKGYKTCFSYVKTFRFASYDLFLNFTKFLKKLNRVEHFNISKDLR